MASGDDFRIVVGSDVPASQHPLLLPGDDNAPRVEYDAIVERRDLGDIRAVIKASLALEQLTLQRQKWITFG